MNAGYATPQIESKTIKLGHAFLAMKHANLAKHLEQRIALNALLIGFCTKEDAINMNVQQVPISLKKKTLVLSNVQLGPLVTLQPSFAKKRISVLMFNIT